MSAELEGPPGELSVNTPTQNMQTTASYLKRQSLLAITGTATGGEDDEAKMRKDGPSEFTQGWIDYVRSLNRTSDEYKTALRDARKAFNEARDAEGLRAFNAAVA